MPKKSIILLPETEEILEQMGLQIKYARLRRKLVGGVSGRTCGNQQGNFGFNRERLHHQ